MDKNNHWYIEFSKLNAEDLLEKYNAIQDKITTMIAIDDVDDLMDQQDALEQIMIDKGIMNSNGELK